MFFGIIPLLLGAAITVEAACPSSSEASLISNNQVEFLYLRQDLTFEAARKKCQDLNFTDLAVLNTQDKACVVEEFLRSHPPINQDTWIGLFSQTDEGDYRWLDGNELGWTSWISSGKWIEPDNIENSRCVRIQKFDTYDWGTKPCSKQLGALCERKVKNSSQCSSNSSRSMSSFALEARDVDITDQSGTTYDNVRSVLDCAERCTMKCCQYFLFGPDTCKVLTSRKDVNTSGESTRLYKRQDV